MDSDLQMLLRQHQEAVALVQSGVLKWEINNSVPESVCGYVAMHGNWMLNVMTFPTKDGPHSECVAMCGNVIRFTPEEAKLAADQAAQQHAQKN